MIFSTERLIIRPLNIEDLDAYHQMQGNPNVMKYLGKKAMSEEVSRIDMINVIDRYLNPKNTFWVWAVTLKEENTFIGTCAHIINKKNENEIGYRFLESHWRNGYGKEIVKGLIKYAFSKTSANSLFAYVHTENTGSIKILEKYFAFVKEVWNAEEQCWERKYTLKK